MTLTDKIISVNERKNELEGEFERFICSEHWGVVRDYLLKPRITDLEAISYDIDGIVKATETPESFGIRVSVAMQAAQLLQNVVDECERTRKLLEDRANGTDNGTIS